MDSPTETFNSLLDFGNILQREEYGKETSNCIGLKGFFAKPASSSKLAAIMDVAMRDHAYGGELMSQRILAVHITTMPLGI